MKKLPITNPSFEYLETSFREWLDIMGFATDSVKNMPNHIRELMYHLEKQGIKQISDLKHIHIKSYYNYISSRPHQRRSGGLSSKYIAMHLQAIAKFLEYLHQKGIVAPSSIGFTLPQYQTQTATTLSTDEIKTLFNATERERKHPKQEALNARDRAMLVVYYSCGLRRNEGVNLRIDDINFDTNLLHVRKGKNYTQRFVPFNKTNAAYLQEYIYDHRPQLIKSKTENALFISTLHKPMQKDALYKSLKKLQTHSEDIHLKQKDIGLHTLRHSIATHLLQAGMSLEKISRFLGHKSLDSTQIYTHLAQYE